MHKKHDKDTRFSDLDVELTHANSPNGVPREFYFRQVHFGEGQSFKVGQLVRTNDIKGKKYGKIEHFKVQVEEGRDYRFPQDRYSNTVTNPGLQGQHAFDKEWSVSATGKVTLARYPQKVWGYDEKVRREPLDVL